MKIHYHSECSFFAGCERMLLHLWSSEALRARADVSFSYPANRHYWAGLCAAYTPDFPVRVMPTLSGDFPRKHWNGPFLRPLSKALRALNRLVLSGPLFLWEVLQGVRILRRFRPDVLHLNNGGYPAARSVRAMAIAGRIVRIPLIIMMVNNQAEPYRSPGRWLGWPIDFLVKRSVDRFVCGSSSARQKLIDVLALGPEDVVRIPNGYARRDIQEPAAQVRARLGVPQGFQGIVLGVVALMVPRKGHRILIEAVEEARNQRPDLSKDLRVFLEGDGPLEESLKQQANAARLDEIIRFVPSEANIADFLAAIDLLALPSVGNEDFPNVVIEAMSYGKAVIASRVAGTPEQVDDRQTGLLVEPGNTSDLAKAIIFCLENRALVATWGAAGLEKYESSFKADVAVKSYLHLYEKGNYP